jgi:SNF2 family DNA or RNA helicase
MLQETGRNYALVKSQESIEMWNRGEIQVGLIHPASVGHGINLQKGGHAICWFGLSWSLEAYEQTNARLWRQGQKSSTVSISHIVTKGSIDEHILKVVRAKDAQQDSVMTALKVKAIKEILGI